MTDKTNFDAEFHAKLSEYMRINNLRIVDKREVERIERIREIMNHNPAKV